jgi:hypothetical protein
MEMKMKKLNFDWRSVALGMVLCLVLVVFVGSRSTQSEQLTSRVRANQGNATLNDVMAKCELIDQRILILEGKINRLQEDMNRVLDDTGNIRRQVVKR